MWLVAGFAMPAQSSLGFDVAAVPPIRLAPGGLRDLGVLAAGLVSPPARAALILDRFLAESGIGARAGEALSAAGFAVRLYDGIAGEPGIAEVRAATEIARASDLVVGLGGGSALDVAKIAAALARDDGDPLSFASAARVLPSRGVPRILVPSTAGTGAESSSTAVFAGPDKRKLWIWGPETKADRILLDPELTVTLPPMLTAWTGMDAFVHAFEAATNRHAHHGAALYAHHAMRLIHDALPRAVATPGDMSARGDLLLAACYGGIAIDNCSTAIAHNISHALAGLGPVPHGLATALAFEVTLPWLVEAETPALAAAAGALGLAGASALPAMVGALMDRAGILRRLPDAFAEIAPAALAAEMRAPETAPMRAATARQVTDADIDRFAEAMLALAPKRQEA